MTEKIVPIYTSRGDAEAFMQFPYLYNRNGEWIGFVNSQQEVFSVIGYYVGKITSDPRIIRRRSDESRSRLQPPHKPENLRISATIALPRMMSDLSQEFIDVLQEDPELLHTLDAGDLRPDMD